MTLVDEADNGSPSLVYDNFWDEGFMAPLYSHEAAKRTVHPLVGSASKIKYA